MFNLSNINQFLHSEILCKIHLDGFVRERHNSNANEPELHLYYTNPSIFNVYISLLSYSGSCSNASHRSIVKNIFSSDIFIWIYHHTSYTYLNLYIISPYILVAISLQVVLTHFLNYLGRFCMYAIWIKHLRGSSRFFQFVSTITTYKLNAAIPRHLNQGSIGPRRRRHLSKMWLHDEAELPCLHKPNYELCNTALNTCQMSSYFQITPNCKLKHPHNMSRLRWAS